MVRSHTVMVWSDNLPKKSLVGGWVGRWQTKFSVSPGPGLGSLVLGPSGPDLDLTWDLDLSLTISKKTFDANGSCFIESLAGGK